MGFVCGRKSRAAMLPAKRKGRIVIEFSGTGSAQGKPEKCANHIGTNCISLRPADRLAYLNSGTGRITSSWPGTRKRLRPRGANMEVGLTDCFSRLRAESGNGKACDALHTSRFCTDIRRYNLCGSALGRLDGDTGRSAGRGPTRTAAGRAQTGGFHDRDRRSAWRRRTPDHRCRSARQCCEPHGSDAGRRGASGCRTSGRMGASGALSLASGRCDRRGAAIGFVAAATAAAWAGSPPAPGYCWYYTDPSRTQGFWDVCP